MSTAVAEDEQEDIDADAFGIQLVDLDPASALAVQGRTNHGLITAWANDVECTTADASGETPPLLQVGLPDQPDECSREGSIVTLTNDRDQELFETFVLTPGSTEELFNYAPGPMHSGEADAEVSPATTGHGSTPAGAGQQLPLLALALAIVALVSARIIVTRSRA